MALTNCTCEHEPDDHDAETGECQWAVPWCTCGDQSGAPRQAGTATQADAAEQARHDLERLGVLTGVRQLTPASAGHAVRIIVGDGSATGVLHLEPQQAADLAHQLIADAQDAIYADRAVRRG